MDIYRIKTFLLTLSCSSCGKPEPTSGDTCTACSTSTGMSRLSQLKPKPYFVSEKGKQDGSKRRRPTWMIIKRAIRNCL